MQPIATDVTHNVVCVCVLDKQVSCAKMAELIKMPFEVRLMWVAAMRGNKLVMWHFTKLL